MSFKKCKVVMLPTNEKAQVGEITSNTTMPELFIMNKKVYKAWNTNYHGNIVDGSHLRGNHLYILSDEEIKEGDWCMELERYSIQDDNIEDCFPYTSVGEDHEDNMKIIASTDKSLKLYESETLAKASGFSLKTDDITLPQPTDAFIQKYIEEYNKGNIITRVLVEYEEI